MSLIQFKPSFVKAVLILVFSFAFFYVTPSIADAKTNNSAKESVDLIISGEYLITMNEQHTMIHNGSIAIKGHLIVDVGLTSTLLQRYEPQKIISGKSKILMPGLINGHTHSAMTLFRGMADDLELMPWLNQYIFPMEAEFVNPAFIRTGAELACWEMIKGGTTTFVDMYFYPEVISEVVKECGLRAIIGAPSIDFPSPGFKGWDDSFDAAINFINTWQGKNERITPAFAPHAPYTVSAEHFSELIKQAKLLHAPVTTHISETKDELSIIEKRYGKTSVQHLWQLGLFDSRPVIAAHMVHPTDEEIEQLAKLGVGVIHNPTSNLKLAAGIAPVVKMLNQGVNVGLGTDGAASNNDLDLWEEMRLVALIQKNAEEDSTVIPAYQALEMATVMGAKAIGLEGVTGQLKKGLRADVIQVQFDSLQLQPLYNVYSHLVYMVDSNDVVTSLVSGNILMEDQKILTINEPQLRADVKNQSIKIQAALLSRKPAY